MRGCGGRCSSARHTREQSVGEQGNSAGSACPAVEGGTRADSSGHVGPAAVLLLAWLRRMALRLLPLLLLLLQPWTWLLPLPPRRPRLLQLAMPRALLMVQMQVQALALAVLQHVSAVTVAAPARTAGSAAVVSMREKQGPMVLPNWASTALLVAGPPAPPSPH